MSGKLLDPPADAPPIDDKTGQHSSIWSQYHQEVADQISAMQAQIAALTASTSTLPGGVTDGSDAAAGKVGEYLTATGSGVGLTSGTNSNVTSLTLPAGDWDVSGGVTFSPSAGTNSFFGVGIGGLETDLAATFAAAALNQALNTATRRYSVSATTTVAVVARAVFTGTCTATGTVRARRVR